MQSRFVSVFVALLLVPSALAAAGPQSAVKSLLGSTVDNSRMADNYFAEGPTRIASPIAAAAHHVVATVVVPVDGPDAEDGIAFWVFPTAADAQAALGAAGAVVPGIHSKAVGRVPGVAGRTVLLAGATSSANLLYESVTNTVTVAAAVSGTVVVIGYVRATDGSSHSKPAVAFLKAGLAYSSAALPSSR
ncbi:MAG: hypothetical protein WCH31_09960 [Actinomycetes bacterium]